MRPIELLRSAPFRLALGLAAALTGSTVVIFGFIYWQAALIESQRVGSYLELEAAEAVAAPDAQLLAQVKTRLANDLHHNSFGALYDAQGRLIAGNLAAVPPELPVDGVAHRILATPLDPPSAEIKAAVLVARRRDDGSVLVIGHDLDQVLALQNVVGQALELALLPTVVLALLVGAFISTRALDRVKRLHQTIGRIMAGHLDERLPVGGSSDDLDRLAEAINRMLDVIVHLMDEIKSAGDNIAHDLRTPLSVMHARLERSLDEDQPTELKATVRQALTDLEKTFAIITALLRVAEIEDNRRRGGFVPTNLVGVVEEVFELYEPLAEANSIDFVLVRGNPPAIEADRDLLVEATANLVDNALKFTPRGGRVRIEAGLAEGAPVIRVSDSGPGIPEAEREEVIKRFYRSEKHRQTRGSGLGLSLVAAIAKLHGFPLRIADAGPGASFELICQRSVAGVSGAVLPDRWRGPAQWLARLSSSWRKDVSGQRDRSRLPAD